MINISHDDLIWLSGILEGEGCFDLHRKRYPRVRIGMVDRDVVGRVATLFGSSIRGRLKAGVQPLWTAEIQGQRAVEVMELVLPYMGARRSSKIAEILTVHRARLGTERGPLGLDLQRPPGILSPA